MIKAFVEGYTTIGEQLGQVAAGAYRQSSTTTKGRKGPPAQEGSARIPRLIDNYEGSAGYIPRDAFQPEPRLDLYRLFGIVYLIRRFVRLYKIPYEQPCSH